MPNQRTTFQLYIPKDIKQSFDALMLVLDDKNISLSGLLKPVIKKLIAEHVVNQSD